MQEINKTLPSKSILIYALNILLLVVLGYFVEKYIGWSELLSPWKSLSAAPMVGAVIMVFISYCLRAVRIHEYFRARMAGQFGLCLRISLQHNLLNNLLPMRTGELSFPVLLYSYFSLPVARSIPALVLFRLLDIHTLGTLGLFMVGKNIIGLTATIIIASLWLPLPWLGFLLYRQKLNTIGDRTGKMWGILRTVLQSFPQQSSTFWRSWILTVLNWGIKLSVFAWVLTLFVDTSLSVAWLGATAGDLTSILPTHGIAGAGTYEAGTVAALIPFGVPPVDAMKGAINLHVFILGCTIIAGLLSLALPYRKS